MFTWGSASVGAQAAVAPTKSPAKASRAESVEDWGRERTAMMNCPFTWFIYSLLYPLMRKRYHCSFYHHYCFSTNKKMYLYVTLLLAAGANNRSTGYLYLCRRTRGWGDRSLDWGSCWGRHEVSSQNVQSVPCVHGGLQEETQWRIRQW